MSIVDRFATHARITGVVDVGEVEEMTVVDATVGVIQVVVVLVRGAVGGGVQLAIEEHGSVPAGSPFQYVQAKQCWVRTCV